MQEFCAPSSTAMNARRATLAVEHVMRAGSDFLAGFYATVEVPSLQQEGGNPSPAKTSNSVTRNGKRKSAKDVSK